MSLLDRILRRRSGEEPKTAEPNSINDTNLEEKVGTETNVLLKKVQIVEGFKDGDYAARILWDYFTRHGKVIRLGGKLDYKGDITGSPQMKQLGEMLYPISAAFKVTIDDSPYTVEFERNEVSKELRVTVKCNSEKNTLMRELLVSASYDIISLSRKYTSQEPFRKLYEFLKKESMFMKIEGQFNSPPEMIIDEKLGLLPVEAKLLVVIEGMNYVFNISSHLSNEVKVECPVDKVDFVNNLLEDIAEKILDEGEKEVKSLEFAVPVANYTWEMVGGLGEVRKELQRYIEWPLENPELFEQLGTSMPKGILLIGPPGTGKTTIAKILANESGASFYTVSPADINSMWVGGTEKNWRQLFNHARSDVKNGKSAIIFIDEIDGFYTSRATMDRQYLRTSFAQFCQEMEGISDLSNVIVIAATNRYEDLDTALTRPGRFTKKIYIRNPNAEGRKEILEIYLSKKPLAQNVDIAYLMQATDGFSGAQIKELCDAAAFNAIECYSQANNIEVRYITHELAKGIALVKQDFDAVLADVKEKELA